MESFVHRVYSLVKQIPPGKVATYSQIALLAGSPRSARAVGRALADCKDPDIPCHRVVDRMGGVKAAFDTGAPGGQRALLEAEGVIFRPEGWVELGYCRWDGPEQPPETAGSG